MNIKKNQVFVELEVANWDNTDLSSSLIEICYSQKEYENDLIEVHQVVDLGKHKGKSKYLIIINITRDLDNLGDELDNPYIVKGP
ncbi:hypothetical protein [Brevibacillus brevis]|uniref:hypothetical protein n=1 Tax=Brevibacillus brevis TaxID=1393 RepID=UPI000D109D71|nr:hypothetical protein [Brevibacillus brevis]PSJ66194.1 hypothetical protein C7J99_26990 [Brevibacillus brevis]RED29228.1 hypothetical protein DES34_10612 [Brevibacillus brevis]GEC92604.1 hypothetical protein BBR01nite_49350 [Brevibacillus brevis]VEF87829.1 Uncharacterised protein [Brevibacillus brevis]